MTHGCSGMSDHCGNSSTTFSAYRRTQRQPLPAFFFSLIADPQSATMSCDAVHADDPLVVEGPGVHSETWRNGDAGACVLDWDGKGAPVVTGASTLTLLYEW